MANQSPRIEMCLVLIEGVFVMSFEIIVIAAALSQEISIRTGELVNSRKYKERTSLVSPPITIASKSASQELLLISDRRPERQ